MEKRRIAILGSTGSIGRQTLDVIREHPDRFEVELLTCKGSWGLMAAQAREFDANNVVVCDDTGYLPLSQALADTDTKVFAGMKSVCDLVASDRVDIVVAAMVGFSGLEPTISAIKAGKVIALANKETLVAAGSIVTALSKQHNAPILPVDSEHSAIFQCLMASQGNAISKIHLTASGGPFRTWDKGRIAKATKDMALQHPNWNMGAKITVDSATMMNKGFEVIEAKWLFGVEASQIQVLVHPQSVVHSAVQFEDGSVKAQLGVPDMRLPIQYAFSYPKRLTLSGERLNLFNHPLEFFEPDLDKFRCLALAFEAIERGGNVPCILNAANEIVNRGFLEDKCGFLQMGDIIAETIERTTIITNPSYDDLIRTDREARRIATELMIKN